MGEYWLSVKTSGRLGRLALNRKTSLPSAPCPCLIVYLKHNMSWVNGQIANPLKFHDPWDLFSANFLSAGKQGQRMRMPFEQQQAKSNKETGFYQDEKIKSFTERP